MVETLLIVGDPREFAAVRDHAEQRAARTVRIASLTQIPLPSREGTATNIPLPLREGEKNEIPLPFREGLGEGPGVSAPPVATPARCDSNVRETWATHHSSRPNPPPGPLPSREGETSDESFDLVLVFHHWPDEFTRDNILDLIDRFPLARFVVCQGPWCASYGRTRGDWPPAVCVPAADAIPRIDREIAVLAGRRPPLPLTAGLDEVFAFDHDL